MTCSANNPNMRIIGRTRYSHDQAAAKNLWNVPQPWWRARVLQDPKLHLNSPQEWAEGIRCNTDGTEQRPLRPQTFEGLIFDSPEIDNMLVTLPIRQLFDLNSKPLSEQEAAHAGNQSFPGA